MIESPDVPVEPDKEESPELPNTGVLSFSLVGMILVVIGIRVVKRKRFD